MWAGGDELRCWATVGCGLSGGETRLVQRDGFVAEESHGIGTLEPLIVFSCYCGTLEGRRNGP